MREFQQDQPENSCATSEESSLNLKEFADWVHGRWTKNPRREDLAIMALGLGGEAAEVAAEVYDLLMAAGKTQETLKKVVRGTHQLDRIKLALELGDVLHYWVAIAKRFNLDPEQIIEGNIAKLNAREAAKPGYFSGRTGDAVHQA
jgi:NTP pyrophosphatase (non-canonical NTP hydrolase)